MIFNLFLNKNYYHFKETREGETSKAEEIGKGALKDLGIGRRAQKEKITKIRNKPTLKIITRELNF